MGEKIQMNKIGFEQIAEMKVSEAQEVEKKYIELPEFNYNIKLKESNFAEELVDSLN